MANWNLDPDGYPVPDPRAPRTTLGKVVAVAACVICVGIFAYGLWCLGVVLRHAMGLQP